MRPSASVRPKPSCTGYSLRSGLFCPVPSMAMIVVRSALLELRLAVADNPRPAPSSRSDRISRDSTSVLISEASSTGAKLPRFMSVKACMAGPPSMRMARVRPSLRVVDLARVAGRAGDVEHVFADRRIEMARESDRAAGADWRALGCRIDEEAVLAHVRGIGEALAATAAARDSRTSRNAPRQPRRPAASMFPARCSSSAAATRRPALRPNPGPATRTRRRARARESVCTGHATNQANRPTATTTAQRARSSRLPFQQIDASRYSLRNLSHTPNKLPDDRMAIVYGRKARCKDFRADWLLRY